MSFLPAFCASTWDNFPFPFMFPVSAELLLICDYALLFTDYSLCLQHPGLLCSWALIGICKEEGLSIFGHSYRFYFCLPIPPWKCLYSFYFTLPTRATLPVLFVTRIFLFRSHSCIPPQLLSSCNTCHNKLMLKAQWRELLISLGPKIRKNAKSTEEKSGFKDDT